MKTVDSKFESYIEIVNLIQEGFNQYLQQYDKTYEQTVKPLSVETSLNAQNGNNILLIYRLSRRRQGSQKKLFEEQTFLRPIPVDEYQYIGPTMQQHKYKYFVDNLIEFQFYHTNYFYAQRQQEDFIDYMSMINVFDDNIFRQSGYKIPVFWEQLPDEVLDIGGTKVYKVTLTFQVQTEQIS